MKVLITGSNNPLGTAVAQQLSHTHELRLTDRTPRVGDSRSDPLKDVPFWLCTLSHDDSTKALVSGIDQIIHTEPFNLPDDLGEGDVWADLACRCTYNLLHAAAEQGVSRLLCISTMSIFNAVDPGYVVSTGWRPQPRPLANELGPHLAEFTCREFANVGAIAIAVARIGTLVNPALVPQPARPRFWSKLEDAAQGVVDLLTAAQPSPANEGFFVGGGTSNMFHPHNRIFTIDHFCDNHEGGRPALPLPPIRAPTGAAAPAAGNRVVLFGANGMMGPETVNALRSSPGARPVLVTDVGSPLDKDQIERKRERGEEPIDYDGKLVSFAEVDVADPIAVWTAASGSCCLVNCAVARWQRDISFDVNMRGVLNVVRAAIGCGHDRVINTGPHWTHTGPQESLLLEYGINEEQVPHPGAGLYGITKGLGQEIARVYSEFYPVSEREPHTWHVTLSTVR